jgi:hypothetical protein
VEKGAWAGLTAAGVGWLAQASVDWLWETPAVTVWLFAAGGLALGAPVARRLAAVRSPAAARAADGEPAAAVGAERSPVSAVAAPGGGGPALGPGGPDAEASHDQDAPVGEAAAAAGAPGEDAPGEDAPGGDAPGDAPGEDAPGEDVRGEAPADRPPVARGATPRRRRPWAGWVARIALAAAAAVLAITPVLVHRSQTHLDDAVAAFRQGDCAAATGDALASHDALASRPEPFELLAYCDARAGRRALAVHAIEAAVARDPGDWEFRYDEAIVRAATGLDPRPATRAAVARNPRDARVRDAARWFLHGKHRLWRKRGREAPTIIPPR